MKSRFTYTFLTMIIMLSVVLTACTTATGTTVSPTATTAPFTPASLAAADCKYGGEIKSISAPDPNTVVFDLCTPDPAFLAKAAFAVFEILPKALLDSTGGDSAKIGQNPIGTGPMMVKEWVRGDHLTLVPNPNYWGTKPTTQTLIFKWSKETAARLLAPGPIQDQSSFQPGPSPSDSPPGYNCGPGSTRPHPITLKTSSKPPG